jgi:hypothetical protein
MFNKYLIEIRKETRALATILNDGVEVPLTEEPHYLYCEINNPREITTKVLAPHEIVDVSEDTLLIKP